MMEIRNRLVEIDFEAELLEYEWNKMKLRGGKLLAASPFRDEEHPSFAVNLENGLFIDSGGDGELRKGNFVKLLCWLRNETYEESEEYLLEKYYGLGFKDLDELQLDFSSWETEGEQEESIILDKSILNEFNYRHPYLEQVRGIGDIYQRAVHIGFDPKSNGISIPLFDKDGNLVNIKFRSVKDKRFWYYSTGDKVRNHLWGLHLVNIKKSEHIYIVESEIDALTLWQHKIPAVALMGSSLSRKQKRLILTNEYIKKITIATDNDKAGRRLARQIFEDLNGLVQIDHLNIPKKYKDVNDMTLEDLLSAVNTRKDLFLVW